MLVQVRIVREEAPRKEGGGGGGKDMFLYRREVCAFVCKVQEERKRDKFVLMHVCKEEIWDEENEKGLRKRSVLSE